MSVVLACRNGIGEATPQLRNLARQSIRDGFQVVLVAARGVVVPEDLAAFPELRIRVLEVQEVNARGRAAAAAILRVRTPLVMLVENHSFLEADGLERLSRPDDWRERDAARSPVMRAGNPETLRSLAMFAMVYGHCTAPSSAEPVADLPHHNAMYRRDVLAELENELPGLLENETLLHRRLTAMGYDLRMVPEVQAWHINESRWRRAVSDPFALGLRYARDRRSGWSPARRALYAAALPAVAGLRFRNLVGKARRARDVEAHATAVLPLLLLLSAMAAVGETAGYLGLGPVPESPFWKDFEKHEFHVRGRMAGVVPSEPRLRELLASLPPELP
ncbi:MAG: hypothetical protein PVI57_03770 [Gemmatimonadota bacterium]